jgi:hypothetical protein
VGTDDSAYANKIGTNALGTAAIPNGSDGIMVFEGDHQVGAVGEGANLISGNIGNGILFGVQAGSNNHVTGNKIGVSQAGTSGISNAGDGIQNLGADSVVIRDNLIGANAGDGIEINTNANLIADNYIGSNTAGADLGNGGAGVNVVSGSDNDIRGSTVGNVIGFNDTGIALRLGATITDVSDCFIGTNPAGADLGNDNNGISISGSTNLIGDIVGGGSNGNVIGWNGGHGIFIDGPSNLVFGNYIGTNPAGAVLSNTDNGIEVRSRLNWIGAPALPIPSTVLPDYANEIAFNDGVGVYVRSDAATNNPIRGNSIHDNAALGIDHKPDGMSLNDPGDFDAGPNNGQNYPEIDPGSVYYNSATGLLDVTYRVDTDATAATYPLLVDFYLADAAQEEGEVWLATDSYTSATMSKTVSLPVNIAYIAAGVYLVAAATDSSGGIGNTSEFSPPEPVPEPGGWSLCVAGFVLWGLRRRRVTGGS